MTVNISFKQLESSEAVKAYTRDQSEKLMKYFNGRIEVSWNFSVERAQNHVAHVHLLGNNMNYFAEAVSQDLYASIDIVIDKIEKQLRKHKEIVRDHLHKHGHRTPGGPKGMTFAAG